MVLVGFGGGDYLVIAVPHPSLSWVVVEVVVEVGVGLLQQIVCVFVFGRLFVRKIYVVYAY